MEGLALTSFPEIQERLVFPFYRPKIGPAQSLFQTPAGADKQRRSSSESPQHQKSSINAGGISIEEKLSGRHVVCGVKQQEYIPMHKYSSSHSFGHLLPVNDLNPIYTHSRVPALSRSSDEYGRHYQHYEHQKFIRGANFRLPLPSGVSVSVADRFRAQTSLMFQ